MAQKRSNFPECATISALCVPAKLAKSSGYAYYVEVFNITVRLPRLPAFRDSWPPVQEATPYNLTDKPNT
jgi:hypothetical protein